MAYTGAGIAKTAREGLGSALAALQNDPNVPEDVMSVASNIARAVGALFEAERASSDVDGKAAVKAALGSLSQTLALLQDVRSGHAGIGMATKAIADSMSALFPLTTVPTKHPSAPPPGGTPGVIQVAVPQAAAVPPEARRSSRPAPPKFAANVKRAEIEANIGATTESNFFVGFSGEISDGGVFVATYNVLARNSPVAVLVTLPGGFETKINGYVRFVRDPMDFNAESEPGIGVQFEALNQEQRELILRFIRKRAPLFYED